MKFFVDTAELSEIDELAKTGMVDGVTTNPSLIAKSGKDIKEIIGDICKIVDGPVSAEVTATNHNGMLAEAEVLAKIAENVAIKVPLTWDGLKTCRVISKEWGRDVNVTLCFSPMQALLAAKAGAAYISPFVGRLDDIGENGMGLIEEIREIYDNYPALETEILVASARHVAHVRESALIGADVITLPPNVLRQLANHVLTDKGLDAFLKDWAATGQSIL